MLGRSDEGAFMTTHTIRRAYWGSFTTLFVLVFTVALFAQSRSVAASASTSSVGRDLNSTLLELSRTAPATIQDLDNAQRGDGKLRWVTFWRGDKVHSSTMTAALRRNLQFAVPNLIHNAQASGGSIS